MVLISGESLGFLAWDNCSTRNNLRHHAANCFYAKSKWGHINEKKILSFFRCLTSEDTTLNGSAVSNGLIWVDTSIGFFTVEEVLDELLNLRDTC